LVPSSLQSHGRHIHSRCRSFGSHLRTPLVVHCWILVVRNLVVACWI
jgi:hypothetical protein